MNPFSKRHMFIATDLMTKIPPKLNSTAHPVRGVQIYWGPNSWIPSSIRTDTRYSAGLADVKLSPFNDITLFDTNLHKYRPQSFSYTVVSLASYITSMLTFAHHSCFTHIYNNCTFSLYHLTWEFKNHLSSLSLCFTPFSESKKSDYFWPNLTMILLAIYYI